MYFIVCAFCWCIKDIIYKKMHRMESFKTIILCFFCCVTGDTCTWQCLLCTFLMHCCKFGKEMEWAKGSFMTVYLTTCKDDEQCLVIHSSVIPFLFVTHRVKWQMFTGFCSKKTLREEKPKGVKILLFCWSLKTGCGPWS
jgi:hypothetical protein